MYTKEIVKAAFLELTRLARVEVILDKTEIMLRGIDLPAAHPLWQEWLRLSDECQTQFVEFVESIEAHDRELATHVQPPQEDSREAKQP